MSTPSGRPRDQTYDGLLVHDDLPAGWHLPSRFPGERPDDASAEIDALLGYDDPPKITPRAHRTAPEKPADTK
jgi:hypothetical protein